MKRKLAKDARICVLVPFYRRIEYSQKCIKALEKAQSYDCSFYLVDDGSNDGTKELLESANLPNKKIVAHKKNMGLRDTLIEFIDWVKLYRFDMMTVVGNDCLMPKHWMRDMIEVFAKSDVEILSPNVFPSNAAFKYGSEDTIGKGYRPSKIVGGLWFMYADLVNDITFERHNVNGITGAFNVLKQIIIEKEPKIGWVPEIVVQDIGHWSGMHPEHIKSEAHLEYYQEVGRGVAWG